MKTPIRLWFAMTVLAGWAGGQEIAFNGKWKLIKAESSDLDYFRQATVEFAVGPGDVTVTTWRGPKRAVTEKMTLKTDGQPQPVVITDGSFADNLFMGLIVTRTQ